MFPALPAWHWRAWDVYRYACALLTNPSSDKQSCSSWDNQGQSHVHYQPGPARRLHLHRFTHTALLQPPQRWSPASENGSTSLSPTAAHCQQIRPAVAKRGRKPKILPSAKECIFQAPEIYREGLYRLNLRSLEVYLRIYSGGSRSRYWRPSDPRTGAWGFWPER